MKAKQTLIAIISSLVLLSVSATKVSASDSVSDVVVIKSVSCYGNSCTVFFDDAVIRSVIPNIAEYRICIDGEVCPKNWWTLRQSVSHNSGDFPLDIGKSGSFRFHILTTDLRNIWSPSPITITNTSTINRDVFSTVVTTVTTVATTTQPKVIPSYSSSPVSWSEVERIRAIQNEAFEGLSRSRTNQKSNDEVWSRLFSPLPRLSLPNDNCVGLCFGVPSKANGLPRNTYVSGYFRKDGTWVNPYTRSNP